jgi:hypothetical protein
MTEQAIQSVVDSLNGATEPGVTEDGTRIHLHYTAFGTATPQAKREATRAEELGLPRDRYTGRVSRIWQSRAGDQLVTVLVELERDHKYRTFNLDKGTVHKIVVLGN